MKKIILFLVMMLSLVLIGCTSNTQEKINFDKTSIEIKVGETYKLEIKEDVSLKAVDETIVKVKSEEKEIEGLSKGETTLEIILKSNEDVKIEVKVIVLEKEKTEYTISYELDGGSCDELITSFKDGDKVTLPTPQKEGYDFVGWFEKDVEVTTIENKNYILTAKWIKNVFEIEFDTDGGLLPESFEKIIKFSKDEKVELPVPTKENYVFLGWFEDGKEVVLITNKDYKLTAKWEKIAPQSVVIEMSSVSETYYKGDSIKLVYKVLPEGVSQEVKIRAINPTIAKIDENGEISIISSGQATFKVSCLENLAISSTITITVKNYMDPYKWLDSIQISNPVAKKVKAYDSYAGYDTYVLGSIIYLMFEDIEVIQNMIPEGNGNRPGKTTNGNTFSARYVTFHDVGASGTAKSTSNYCVGKTTEVSWHYTTGNDGIYQQLPLDEVGYHAGDGTRVALQFLDSGVKALDKDHKPGKITINQTTGYFEVNGIQTKIKAPLSGDGDIVKNTELPNDTGINNYVDEKTGNYMISNTWWSQTYQTLGNYGGNLNSIGIESAVNKGSNLWYTWTKSAKLIATIILPETRLLPRDVKQHNTFSGKNCPQTMRMAHLWPEFMNMINAEYERKTQFLNFSFELICDSPYVMKNGLIDPNNLPEKATEISYSVRMINKKENIDETRTYKTVIPAKSSITY
ncbi:MAG: InlB B-repeat-containing protein [Coprobacillus sp.]|nr:InlB B-repeat-containing protein [Coprobacillus sp.]